MKLNEHMQIASIDWAYYRDLAEKMTDDELAYARSDAFKAAQANPKTEGLYMDELSMYAAEQRIRSLKCG